MLRALLNGSLSCLLRWRCGETVKAYLIRTRVARLQVRGGFSGTIATCPNVTVERILFRYAARAALREMPKAVQSTKLQYLVWTNGAHAMRVIGKGRFLAATLKPPAFFVELH